MSQVTRLARLAGRILPPDPSVHMGNFSPVSELGFQPGYCPYGQFQRLGYRDEQGVIGFKFQPGNLAGVFFPSFISFPPSHMNRSKFLQKKDLVNPARPGLTGLIRRGSW